MRFVMFARATAFAVVLSSASYAPALAAPIAGPLERLQLSLSSMATHAPGNVGISVQELSTGLTTTVNARANMPAASVIKIPVMVEVFRQMDAGTLTLTRRVRLAASDRDWGWGDLADAPPGGTYTVDNLLRAMIAKSDNTATNMLIRLVGRAHVNATMAKLGLRQTRLGGDIRSEGDIRSLRTSAADMTQLLSRMAHERLINPWSSREMLAILAGQQHNGLLPAPLPRGLAVAHKTGTLHDTLNDVGVVFLDDDPYVISVMTTRLRDLDAGRSFIRAVSHTAYLAFARRASERLDGAPQLPQSGPLSPSRDAVPGARPQASASSDDDLGNDEVPERRMWTQPATVRPSSEDDASDV